MLSKAFLTLAFICAVSVLGERTASTSTQVSSFVVGIWYDDGNGQDLRCAGALISSWHVLSTAYCLEDLDVYKLRISTGEITTTVDEVNFHPDFERKPRTADIALVLLHEYLHVGGATAAAYIPPQESAIPAGQVVKAVTLGTDETGQKLLKTVNAKIISQDRCKKAFSKNKEVSISEQVLCARTRSTRSDIGAVLILGDHQVGLHSYTGDGNTDLYTRVDRHTGWILMHAVQPESRAPWQNTYLNVVPLVIGDKQ